MRWMRVLGVAAVLVGPVWGQVSAPAKPAAPVSVPLTPEQEIEGMQKKLADWAQVGRYREAHAALPGHAAGERRVVFYGDSITEAWVRSEGVFFPGKSYVGRGISGQTTPQMVVRFQQDVVHLKPAVVVILAGTNDIAGNTGPSTPERIEEKLSSIGGSA